jgi:hypothetical protein
MSPVRFLISLISLVLHAQLNYQIRSEYSPIRRWISRNVPFVQLMVRWLVYWRVRHSFAMILYSPLFDIISWQHELLYLLVFGNNTLRRLAMKVTLSPFYLYFAIFYEARLTLGCTGGTTLY